MATSTKEKTIEQRCYLRMRPLKLSKGSQAKPSPTRQLLNKFLKDMREHVIMYLRRIFNREGTGSAKVPREDLSGAFEEDEGGWYG